MFRSISCLFAVGVWAVNAELESYHMNRPFGGRPHMWVFGEQGVTIYRPDGSDVVKQVPADVACHNVTSGDSFRIRCDFYDVVSDGKKYVWAAVSRGVPMIDVFSLQTGDLVGSFETCDGVYDLDYHPLREEIWAHCAKFTEIEQSHMDVFSTVSPSVPINATVTLHDNTALRSFGKLTTHPSLGDAGYATVYGMPYLHRIDLSGRRVEESVLLGSDNPKVYGVYELAYSPVNQHLFVRSQVCCTCGFDGADLKECGRYGSQNITVNGQLVEGQCGRHCEGGPTDTVGIYEINTKTHQIVGTHSIVGSGVADAAFTSPDGEHIVLFGMNGGKSVEILKANGNGQKSTVQYNINLNFNITNVEDFSVFADFAFVKDQTKNCFALSSSNENKVAIVDLNSNTNDPSVTYVNFKSKPFEGRSRTRQVEWAYGTHFVWVSGPNDDEAYVIDVVKKELVTTISIDPRKFLSVVNFDFLGFSNQLDRHWTDDGSRGHGGHHGGSASTNALRSEDSSSDQSTSDALSIAAIFFSVIAIVAVVVNLAMTMKANAAPTSTVAAKEDQSLVVPSVN